MKYCIKVVHKRPFNWNGDPCEFSFVEAYPHKYTFENTPICYTNGYVDGNGNIIEYHWFNDKDDAYEYMCSINDSLK